MLDREKEAKEAAQAEAAMAEASISDEASTSAPAANTSSAADYDVDTIAALKVAPNGN